jgi:hypothetical protein
MTLESATSSIDDYRSLYRQAKFGWQEALAIARKHGLQGMPRRNFEASNVVFEFGNAWLKLSPMFWREAHLAEQRVLEAWDGQLPLRIPRLIAADSFEGWSYLITEHVSGEHYKNLAPALASDGHMSFAQQIGELIGAISHLSPLGLPCDGGHWTEFAHHQVEQAAHLHRKRTHRQVWPPQIAEFLQRNAHLVLRLSNLRTLHADINGNHLLFDGATSEIVGLIDFADAMDAPIELDFVLPFVCFFKGNHALQKRAIQASGVPFGFAQQEYSNGMMALTLMNRFICFEEWFDAELSSGAASIEEVARRVYPSESLIEGYNNV